MQKLKLTVLFLFSSVVIFGQAIEYRDFEFSQNGKSLSLYQVEKLADSLSTGKLRLYLAKNLFRVSESSAKTVTRNLSNATVGVFSISIGSVGIGFYQYNDENLLLGLGGAAMIRVGLNSVRFIGTKARYARRADKNFKRVARNLNQEIIKY